MKLIKNDLYLLLIDEETKINLIDLVYDWFNNQIRKYEDIGTGRKIIAHYPLTKEVKELELPLLPNPFEEVDVEKLALKKLGYENDLDITNEAWEDVNTFIRGYKAAQSKGQYSLEDMKKAFHTGRLYQGREGDTSLEEYIQSLSTQRAPKEFIPEYNLMNEGYDKPEDYPYQECKVLKTTTNSSGKIELVGIYKY